MILLSRAHTAWLLARIRTLPDIPVFETTNEQPDKTLTPYVVVHPASGVDDQRRYTGPRLTQNPRFTIHSVGEDADQAAALGEMIKSLLVVNGFGVIPTITGERSERFWWDSPTPVQVDKDINPWVVYHVAECGFSSTPIV